MYARVYGRADALRPILAAVQAEVLTDYGAFSLARLTSAGADALTALGVGVVPETNLFEQVVNGYRFDVRRGDGVVPSERRTQATGSPRYWIVHFLGPILPAWRAAVEATGAVVLDYMPFYSYLVRADPTSRARLEALPFVVWVGAYHPGYKIFPSLFSENGPVDVRVVMFPGESSLDVVALLSRIGSARLAPDGILRDPAAPKTLRLHVDSTAVAGLAALPGVAYIAPVVAVRPMNANMQWVVQTNVSTPLPSRRLWDLGLRGDGQVIAIADTGIDYDHAMFRESLGTIQTGDIYNVTDASRRKIVRYWPVGILTTGDTTWPALGGDTWAIRDSPDTYNAVTDCRFGHGTLSDGTGAGNDATIGPSANDGSASNAKIYFLDIGTVGFDPMCGPQGGPADFLSYLPNDLGDLFRIPYDDPTAPARIVSNSWGSADTAYDLLARQVDAFMWTHPDMLVIFSAGNDGPQPRTIATPAMNKDGLAVGATNSPSNLGSQDDLFVFSSHGPTSDGRMKPDVTAPGVGVSSDSDGNPTSSLQIMKETLWAGTSYSAPTAAGAAAMIRQYFVNGWYPTGAPISANGFAPSGALLKAMLSASGAQMTCATQCGRDLNTYPNFAQGWGRILLDDVLYFAGDARSLYVRDDSPGLSTGESVSFPIRVTSSTPSLRILLAWSDYPAAVNANPALVNDLDLTVRDPSGITYRGNVFSTFSDGQSQPGGTPDRLNPMEGVIRKAPAAGVWIVTVTAANVPFGLQPFAVVAVGAVDLGYGVLSLDRTTYAGNDRMAITVLDANAASASVSVSSGTEPAGEIVSLAQSAPGSGVWSGGLATELGAARPDGVLQVSDGDAITVTYVDTSPSHTATASARVDVRGPVVTAVRVTNITDASATVRWTTNKPAASSVYFGLGALDHLARARELVTVHAMRLDGLRPDTEYLFDILSTDRTGQRTIDDHGGLHHRFRTAEQSHVLLVIGDSTFPEERTAAYGRAFASRGWTITEWRVAERGVPSFETLRRYLAVVWNPGLEEYPMVPPTERALLKAYVDGGGRLLFSSHDVAWDLCSGDASSHTTPATCAWVKGTLHASWKVDPSTFPTLVGVAGNPVSGGYTAGVSYTPHRTGGAGDEIGFVAAGGTTTSVWKDSGPSTNRDDVGVLWQSSAPNRTASAGCVWCGSPSRVAAYFFEATGIEFATADSGVRTDILDATVIWLLGRDHPDVVITSPNGGETFTGDTARIAWTRTAHGAGVASQVLSFSRNSGESWEPIATVPGTTTEYIWDLRGLPNGIRYRVRVGVYDDGSPRFFKADASDGDFTIARPGGDAGGPVIISGSLTVAPNPPRSGGGVWVNATADDRDFGGSNIAAGEWFVQDAEPLPAQTGTGIPMAAVVPPFDAPVEAMSTATIVTWSVGPLCIWVHARDAAGLWGPFAQRCAFVVGTSGDVTPPARATITAADLSGAGNADVRIAWTRASDDTPIPTPGGTTVYRVMRANAPEGPYVLVGSQVASGSASYAFVDIGAGAGSSEPRFFYRVRTVDAAGNAAESAELAARITIPLRAGLNAVSIPLILGAPSAALVFPSNVARGAWAYDACGAGWLSYVPGRPGNSLTSISLGMGLFVNATTAGGLTVAGLVPTSTSVSLCAGWNLVGFPSASRSIVAADVRGAVGASQVLASDPNAYPSLMSAADASQLFLATQAFWLYVASAVTWTVPGR